MAGHQRGQLRLGGHRDGVRRRRGVLDPADVRAERGAIGGRGRPRRRGADQRQPLAERALEVLAAGVALLEVGEPRAERLRERLDRVAIASDRRQRERARPAVVVHVVHRALAPRAVAVAAIAQVSDQRVVAVFEDVGRDLEDRPDLALDGIPAAVHGRREAFDDDGAPGRVDRARAHGRVTGRG